ncbi:MAG: TonB family protein [Caulobacteraceae bacterium]|nr:TonB family protein [Caulobacteraceae bacterium]
MILAAFLAAFIAAPGQDAAPDHAPQWASAPRVEFPQAAVGHADQGRVSLACVVETDGNTRDCTVESEEPAGVGFGQAALDAAPGFRFTPASRNGSVVVETIRFNLSFRTEAPSSTSGANRAPDQLQQVFSLIDRLGFTSGECAPHLEPQRRDELRAGLIALSGGQTLPVLDQVLFGGFGRGLASVQGQAPDQTPNADFCASALASAQRAVDADSETIDRIRASFPSAAERTP